MRGRWTQPTATAAAAAARSKTPTPCHQGWPLAMPTGWRIPLQPSLIPPPLLRCPSTASSVASGGVGSRRDSATADQQGAVRPTAAAQPRLRCKCSPSAGCGHVVVRGDQARVLSSLQAAVWTAQVPFAGVTVVPVQQAALARRVRAHRLSSRPTGRWAVGLRGLGSGECRAAKQPVPGSPASPGSPSWRTGSLQQPSPGHVPQAPTRLAPPCHPHRRSQAGPQASAGICRAATGTVQMDHCATAR